MDDLDRARRWESFYTQELKGAMQGLRQSYRDSIDLNQINDTDRLKTLLIADKVAQDIESMFANIAADGQIIAHRKAHLEKLEELPERKRSILRKIGM